MSNAQQQIDELVKSNEIVLFMKGSANFPMCGFSGRSIQILKACGVDTKTLKTVNVLEDEGVRQGIKEYSQWPTIPQLYVNGEFIGGSDIMMEMYESVAPTAKSPVTTGLFFVDRTRRLVAQFRQDSLCQAIGRQFFRFGRTP